MRARSRYRRATGGRENGEDDPRSVLSKGVCSCNIVKDASPYVMVADTYNDQTCTTGLYSSARVKDMLGVTDFLKTNEHLKPFELKVVGGTSNGRQFPGTRSRTSSVESVRQYPLKHWRAAA